MLRGFIAGSFDLMHPGYIMSFIEAKKKCDYLTVGLQNDPTFDRPEKSKPVNTLFERHLVLSSIRYVDKIVIYNTEAELEHLLMMKPPDVRFLGDDYKGVSSSKVTGYLYCKNIIYLDRGHGYSTTKFKEKIAESMK
jgi:glycerol-3-phosphate cytidylyltransferase